MEEKQPTPIGPIMVALRWSFPAPKATRRAPDKVRQRRWIERRYGGGYVSQFAKLLVRVGEARAEYFGGR